MKTFLATFIGLVAAFVVMMGLEIVGHLLFPVPFDPEQTSAIDFTKIPMGAYIAVVFAHSIGLMAGLIIAKMIDKATLFPLFLIAGFLLIGTIANLYQIPHPMWFAIADIGAVLLMAILVIMNARKKLAQEN